MKIDFEMIKKIFNRKIKLKNKKDKIALSLYSDYVPMYDIFSENIYPINCMKLYYRLVECHYRFITDEIKQWIKNKMSKNKGDHYQDMLDIINNYDLETLEKTSYETLYRYSPDYGLSISICKRNSFHPFSFHLNPYYSKNELIKLGMNNKLIDELEPTKLVDKKLHYDICKLVSKNDIGYETILNHMNIIIKNKCISWINFYSMTGSYMFNKILREKLPINEYLFDGLTKIINTINKAELPNDYYVYRFVWDDEHLKNLKVNDIFIDKGFTSTTRDPFYSPGIKMDFGLVLVKINIPKHIKGIGLLIENFSMFPKEEEFLIQPLSKLKLKARDDKSHYFHTNEKFEKLIKKKYEFDLISIKTDILDNLSINIIPDHKIPLIDINNINIDNSRIIDRIGLFKMFLDNCDNFGQFRYNDEIYIAQWFDSTGSYSHMYKNNTKDGFIINKYKNGYPILSIEMGNDLFVNYQRTVCYYDEYLEDENIDNIISHIARIFKYKNVNILFNYKNFTEFNDNYNEFQEFLSTKLYCDTIYKYYKNNINTQPKYYKYEYGYWKLDNIGKQKVPIEIINKVSNININNITWKDLFILIVEKHFHLYKRLEEWMNNSFDNIFNKNYYTFNIIPYLNKQGYDIEDIPTFKHISTFERGDIFKQVYIDNIRRS
jgi:hypothetical protein